MGKRKRKARFNFKCLRYIAELLLAIAAVIHAIKH